MLPNARRAVTKRATRPAHGLLAAVVGVSLLLVACGEASPSRPPTSVSPAVVPDASEAPPSVAPTASTRPIALPNFVGFRVALSNINLPSTRSRAVALVFGSTILVCGGLTRAGTTGSIVRIDLPSGGVGQAGTLAAPVHDAGGSVLGTSGLIIGGGRSGPGTIVQRVRPGARATTVGHLPAARADLAAVSVGGEVVVVGGGTPARPDDRVLATTDGRRFRTVGKLLVGVRYPAIAVVDRMVYVIGGSTLSGDTDVIQTVDPGTGVVRIVGHLAHGLSHGTAFVLGNTLLVAGGRTAGGAQDGLWQLDPAADSVTLVGHLPYAASDMAVAVVDGVGYLIGGEANGQLASIITVSIR